MSGMRPAIRRHRARAGIGCKERAKTETVMPKSGTNGQRTVSNSACSMTAALVAIMVGGAGGLFMSPPAGAFEASSAKPSSSSQTTAPQAAPVRARKSRGKSKTDPAKTKALATGIAAAKAGRYKQAVTHLSTAISGGGLKLNDTARALYYRGMAYRHLEKPALAISDLTSALWKKGALNSAERKSALAERAAAYRSGGHGDQQIATAPTSSSPAASAKKQPTTSGQKRVSTQTPSGTWKTRTASRAARANQPKPQKKASNSSGSFFSNLFGGSNSKPISKANADKRPPARAKPPRTSGNQTSSWATKTKSSPAPSRAAKPRTGKAVRVAKTVRRPSGRYQVQITALRSKTAAEAVARKVRQRHGGLLASRAPTVEKGVLGNMGTLYQVRVGPFRSEAETRKLCAKLLSEGLDCLLVAAK